MQKPESLIMLTPGFPEGAGDSACTPSLRNFALSFHRQYPGTKLIILAFQYPFENRKYELHGAEVHAIGGRNRKGLFRLLTWAKVFAAYISIYRKTRVKGLLSIWLSECTFIARFLGLLSGKTTVAWMLGQDATKANRYLKLIRLKNVKVVALSNRLAEQLENLTGKKADAVISAGIDPSAFEVQPEDKKRYTDIVGVGSLIPLKNYGLFIEIIHRLKKEFPKIKALLIGKGPERQQLEDLIRVKGLQENISLAGELPHAETLRQMQSSRILLHTSTYEGQAVVFMEALYCGLQVVCFDVGRIEADSKMFACKNEEEMVERLKTLLKQEPDTRSLMILHIDDTVREMLELFRVCL